MNKNHMRFENPARLAELKPSETLRKIGLDGNGVVCDIGAGSGIFSLAAAAMTEGMVYAVEISEEMLQVLRDKIAESGVRNIRLIRSENDRLPIEGRSVDIVLMATVLHEIADPSTLLKEIGRILKPGGTLAVIEFHKRATSMGPPVSRRLGRDKVRALLDGMPFSIREDMDLGENFYCLTFTRAPGN